MNVQSTSPPTCQLLAPLTNSEERVLTLMADGLSDKEISLEMSITPITVRGDHKQNIYDKLGLQTGYRNKRWAVHCARQLGIVTLSDDEAEAPSIDNPYKGLDAFQREDAHLFYGREDFVEELLQHIANMDKSSRFLALVGASGSGKSSVIRAGLVPALIQNRVQGASNWRMATMYPRVNPFHELEAALRSVATKQQDDILNLLRRDAYGLVRLSSMIMPADQPLLLVIDQFEELFTLTENEQYARDFMDTIYAAATDPRTQIRIIITLRADFLDRPLMYPDFSWLVQENTLMIGPMNAEEMERAIVLPARQSHVTFDSGVVSKLIAEANQQPGALPLLEFALAELYDSRLGRNITMHTYDEVGGLKKALAAQAEKIYITLKPRQQEAARQLFLRLITLGEDIEDVRRRVTLSELTALEDMGKLMESTVQFLTANRLLTVDIDYQTGEPTVEVAHEALIREWERLRNWLDESRADVRLERLLSSAVAEWETNNRDKSYLMSGTKLIHFQTWRDSSDIVLTDAESAFIDISATEENRKAEERLQEEAHRRTLEQRTRRVLQALVGVMALATIIGLGLAIFAFDGQSQAIAARATAEGEFLKARQLALVNGAQAALSNDDVDSAIAFAMEANQDENPSGQAQLILAEAAYQPGTQQMIQDEGYIWRVVPHPDGQHLLTVDNQSSAWKLWDTTSWQVVRQYGDQTMSAWSGAISPDGTMVAFALGGGGVVALYDVETGEQIRQFEGLQPESPVWDVAFTPDGSRMIAGGGLPDGAERDNNLIMWDVETGEILRQFEGQRGGIPNVTISADGQYLITPGSAGGTGAPSDTGIINMWDIETGEIVRTFGANGEGHQGIVIDVTMSPDGQTLVSVGWDITAYFWNVESGEVFNEFEFADGYGTDISVSMSPDGASTLVAWATSYVFDTGTGEEVAQLHGHPFAVGRGAFLDNQTAVTGGQDSTMRVWDLSYGAENKRVSLQRSQTLGEAVMSDWKTVSDDGQLAVMTGIRSNNQAETPLIIDVFDLNSGELLRTVTIPDAVNAINSRFVPDSSDVVTILENGTLIRWSAATGEELQRYEINETNMFLVPFNDSTKYAMLTRQENSLQPEDPILLVDLENGSILRFVAEGLTPVGVALSLDHSTLITGSFEGTIVMWDVASGEEIRRVDAHPSIVIVRDVSPDGSTFVSGAIDGEVVVWDMTTGEALHRFTNHSQVPIEIRYSPDGRYLMSVGQMESLLFDLEANELIRRFSDFVVLYDWVDADEILVSERGFSSIWRLVWWRFDNPESLLDWVEENRYARDLTCEEREQFQLEACETDAVALVE